MLDPGPLQEIDDFLAQEAIAEPEGAWRATEGRFKLTNTDGQTMTNPRRIPMVSYPRLRANASPGMDMQTDLVTCACVP